ncbi:hypothetical protein E5676_scaffold1154G00140 [Cucumis melo var. makuwa]|uniref:Uncharacterized protein n=2 Tax=Cucumis melo TaxID=3656 RepID=A0A5D3BWV4_CUCMM|nr:hypothetical protein E6C27_scaffold288G00480 [Cucumis melo var. makuwa]TYK02716.1 hypothetical protein E5676_scaffold1154G00140 [Cucumis melo var. makuwa]
MSADWGPVVVAVALFILLSPGLLFQLPARIRVVEFGNMNTSGIAILKREERQEEEVTGSASVDVDMESENENSIEDEEDESVYSNSFSVGLHAPELKLTIIPGKLKQKPGRKQYEEYNSDDHGCPIRHSFTDIVKE